MKGLEKHPKGLEIKRINNQIKSLVEGTDYTDKQAKRRASLKIRSLLEKRERLYNVNRDLVHVSQILGTIVIPFQIGLFETRFGRRLTVDEQKLIVAWTASYSEELVIEAVNRAARVGKLDFDFINNILVEWERLGLKNGSDIKDFEKGLNYKKGVVG